MTSDKYQYDLSSVCNIDENPMYFVVPRNSIVHPYDIHGDMTMCTVNICVFNTLEIKWPWQSVKV